MGGSSEDAKKYLTRHDIPVLFESLMTGLMYNKPDDHVDFMIRALRVVQQDADDKKISWDSFIDPPPLEDRKSNLVSHSTSKRVSNAAKDAPNGTSVSKLDVFQEATQAVIPDVPVILFMGGPGGLKTKYSEKVARDFKSENLVHLSMRHLIEQALIDYKDDDEKWELAAEQFDAGERIDNALAMALLKTQMGAHPEAAAFFLEGFPKDIQQIQMFEKDVHEVTMAIILDYDEETLKKQMQIKKLAEAAIDDRMHFFKTKTLPAAKYFDDKILLNLIAGEQDEKDIHEQLENLVLQVLHPKAFGKPRKSSIGAGLAKANATPNTIPLVLIVGAPGSQKTQFCRKLVKRYEKFVHLSMGELLRQDSIQWGVEHKKVKEAMQAGNLVPSEMCKTLIKKQLDANASAWGIIIEGYPRNVKQAEELENMVAKIDMAILIDCTETYCMKTLRSRMESTGIDKRLDDNEVAIRKRLDLFKESTLPMLKYFDEKKTLKVVDGDRALDDIFEDLANIIDNTLFISTDSGSGKSLASSKNSTK